MCINISLTYNDLICEFPDKEDSNRIFRDIDKITKPLADQFNQYYNQNEFELMKKLLNDNPILKNTLVTADTLQLIYDMCIASQRFYMDDVHDYILNIVEDLGEWFPTNRYSKFKVVHYNGIPYMATKLEIPIGTAPTNANYFLPMGIKGEKGADGSTFESNTYLSVLEPVLKEGDYWYNITNERQDGSVEAVLKHKNSDGDIVKIHPDDTVSLSTNQLITGGKTFTEHVVLPDSISGYWEDSVRIKDNALTVQKTIKGEQLDAKHYNNINEPLVTQEEAELGMDDNIKMWSPIRVHQAINALTPKGGKGSHYVYVAAIDTPDDEKTIADFQCTGTNDGAIINQAIALAQSKSGFVFLLSGKFNLGATEGIELNPGSRNVISLQGAGVGRTTITETYSFNIYPSYQTKCILRDLHIINNNPSASFPGVNVMGAEGECYIENVRVSANTLAYQTSAFYLNNNFTGTLKMHRCSSYRKSYGVYVRGNSSLKEGFIFTENKFEEADICIFFNSSSIAHTTRVENNLFLHKSTGAAINMNGSGVGNFTIQNNKCDNGRLFWGATAGIYQNVNIVQNFVKNASAADVYIAGIPNGVNISNNNFQNEIKLKYSGVGGRNVNISDNTCKNIYIVGAGNMETVSLSNLIVKGNIVTGIDASNIDIDAHRNNVDIRGNIGGLVHVGDTAKPWRDIT